MTGAERFTSSPRDRHEQMPLASAPAATPFAFAAPAVIFLDDSPDRALLASAAGPPLLALRI